MKLANLFILTTTTLTIAGCVGQVAKQQAVVNASVPVSLTPAQSLNKSVVAQNSLAIQSGSFVSGEHKTQGTVRITTKEGKSTLELGQSFKTSDSGPDLVVILHRSDNVIGSTQPPSYPLKKGDYVILAPLQKYSGVQSYIIPTNINLADYKSVGILCRKYNATFGAAKLSS
ncbi:DM13 domain-containing protein [Tolypothrix sp. FACHB-123]|uniref:DM13 domain-containing protein n=1 Tax=Tolypothrix sp. FACHB-123 TaxID=2692868 RepID=UPI001682886D|nr:DM13 domain-containing protein [Tolypothrix sp. FACHB-123]MBD2356841.1 DM13 domain-containing protein [Tolypothrix sp. FACHB-123]